MGFLISANMEIVKIQEDYVLTLGLTIQEAYVLAKLYTRYVPSIQYSLTLHDLSGLFPLLSNKPDTYYRVLKSLKSKQALRLMHKGNGVYVMIIREQK